MPRRRPPQPKYQAHQLIKLFPATFTSSEIAKRFRVDSQTVRRWRNPDTTFSSWEADRYAIKLGKHPSEIWVDWFDWYDR